MNPIDNPTDRIFVALDLTDVGEAVDIARALVGRVGGVKIGKQFFTANGPEGVQRIAEVGLPLFLDLKFHDIPSTVGAAVRAALPMRPHLLNVHAAGGARMMRAAAEAAASAGSARPRVLAVTVLTSLGDQELAEVGMTVNLRQFVARLAVLAKNCGLDGVVCSCSELMTIRGACGQDFILVCPGIRPSWASGDDHRRLLTPAEALALGADYLVIGRPIVRAADPAAAATRIGDEIAAELHVG
ncbi:MAG: orotidine-5'-phosphate decarboxylase [Rhodospirillales bacterium]|nr:MAG: orotidine-5'-phosphate decarboxylase [Rhodospirillales bacterium]